MIRLAHGPVVDALKRYDPGLRVRWSYEKNAWAVEAPLLSREDMLPPVFYEQKPNGEYIERLLPELSERYISYRDGTYVLCWVKQLKTPLVGIIAQRDQAKMHGGGMGQMKRNIQADNEHKNRAAEKRQQERCYEAYDRFKSHARNKPWLEDGTGTSIKGMA